MPDPQKSEEINLDPNIPLKQQTDKITNNQDDVNVMDTAVGDLSGLFGPGSTNEEFVQRILQTSEEKLIPWEECHIPSRGIYYSWPDGIVMVRAMGQTAEKVLATQRLAQSGQSIDYLFKECCKFPDGFDSTDLLLGDRVFLLYFIRGITHGKNYEFAITCPNQNCESVSTHSYDLMNLVQTIKWANPTLGHEPFKVVLPYLSQATQREVWVGVRFLRGSDANDIIAKRKVHKKTFARPGGVRTNSRHGQIPTDPRQQQQQAQVIDNTISDNMGKIIVNIMGVTDFFQIRQFIEKMHAQDTAAIREWLRDNTPGIDNTVTVECPECGQEFTVELPITESFFRPSKK